VAYAFVALAVGSTWGILRSEDLLRRVSPWLARLGWPDAVVSTPAAKDAHAPPRIFLLGFFRTASSLLEEITRQRPNLLEELAVVDFNPEVYRDLQRRGVRVIYGDISQRDTLLHAGVDKAEILVCTLPNSLLKARRISACSDNCGS